MTIKIELTGTSSMWFAAFSAKTIKAMRQKGRERGQAESQEERTDLPEPTIE